MGKPKASWKLLVILQSHPPHSSWDVASYFCLLEAMRFLLSIHIPLRSLGSRFWGLTFLNLNAAFLIRAAWFCTSFYSSLITLSHWACGQPQSPKTSHVIFSALYLWIDFFFGPKYMTWHLSLLSFHLVKVSQSLYDSTRSRLYHPSCSVSLPSPSHWQISVSSDSANHFHFHLPR